jgi:alanine dehydrogenase
VLTATDDDVLAFPAAEAVAAMWEAVGAHGAGELCAPARTTIALGEASMTLTSGRLPGVASGFRLYSSAPEAPSEVTLIFQPGAEPIGIVLGKNLGRRRTGALGGVAARLCAREDAGTIGFIGAGEQAYTQLWAIATVRDLQLVKVHSRSPATAERFAAKARSELGLTVDVVGGARDAVAGSDILVLSTPARSPLIEASWIEPGTHVHTLGPKGAAEGECPKDLVQAATLLVSDSPVQLSAMEGLDSPWTGGRVAISLGEILVGASPGRVSRDDITLYASVGLSGTEVLLASRILNGAK